jgi:ATP-binding protein involved in chromosome partitioning
MSITKEKVLSALSYVEDPDLKKDLVTLNMIQDIVIDGKNVSFSVVLTTPACPMKEMIHNACKNAIVHMVDSDAIVDINMTHDVQQSGDSSPDSQIGKIKNIIAVVSGKGGVGKSTVAANLATSLALEGAKVGIIDADIHGPSIPAMFGLEGTKPGAQKDADGNDLMIPPIQFGVKVMSIAFFTTPEQPIPWRGPMVSSAMKQFFNDTEWGELDYLIVDLPPGTGDIHLTLLQSFPVTGAVVVTTPQKVSVNDTRRAMGMLKMDQINVPILGIIENMSYFTPAELPDNKYFLFGKGGGAALAQEFGVELLGEIPLVQGVVEGGDEGHPVVMDNTHPAGQAIREISKSIAQKAALLQIKNKQNQPQTA